MGIFKDEPDTKRVIFSIRLDLAERLETTKRNARGFGKKLDVDAAVDKALEKFLKKAEKKIHELSKKYGNGPSRIERPDEKGGEDDGVEISGLIPETIEEEKS